MEVAIKWQMKAPSGHGSILWLDSIKVDVLVVIISFCKMLLLGENGLRVNGISLALCIVSYNCI